MPVHYEVDPVRLTPTAFVMRSIQFVMWPTTFIMRSIQFVVVGQVDYEVGLMPP